MSKLYVEIRSGLGNQLFQFAFGFALASEFNKELVLSPSYFDNGWKYFIKKFIGREVRSFRLPLIVKDSFSLEPPGSIKEVLQDPDTIVLTEKETDMHEILTALSGDKNVYLKGYWQNPELFAKYKGPLSTLIHPSFQLSDVCKDIVSTMNDNYVGIHVRRGDFLTNRAFGACQFNYYERAIEKIGSLVRDPIFIVFTNDKNWVDKEFSRLVPFRIYSNTDSTTDIEELYLMTKFRTLIISNSTFSWWGAYLNRNMTKTIVCPRNWNLNKELQAKSATLISDNWIVLDNRLELKN
jgi:hypothetical protein